MRRAKDIELAITPRPDGRFRHRWLYEEIRAAILAGSLAPGARLPATRDIAQRHRLSRGTVLGVFAQLAAEGYVVGAVGRGTFVAPVLPDPPLRPPEGAPVPPPDRGGGATLSARGRQLARTVFPQAGQVLPALAFRASQPDLAAFPFALWARIAARRARLSHRSVLADGEARGFRPLRAAIAEHLGAARGIACTADQVVITGSVQQILDLGARLTLDSGDRAWIEDPGYPGARLVLEAAGARVVGVPVDGGGIDVAAGRALAPDARLAYVTAGRQAPLGCVLTLERRLALLAWAAEAGATIIEDDYDSEFRFEGSPLAAMKGLDDGGRVIYAGTFSKVLFPAIRMAYAVVPEHLAESFGAALSLTCRHMPLLPQVILHEFIAEGHFGRHVRRMRLLYAERAKALVSAVRTHLSGLLDLPAITTGLDAPSFLPAGVDDAAVAAAAAGIETRPLSFYRVERPVPPGLVLGFAAVEEAKIHAAAAGLAQVIEPFCRQASPRG